MEWSSPLPKPYMSGKVTGKLVGASSQWRPFHDIKVSSGRYNNRRILHSKKNWMKKSQNMLVWLRKIVVLAQWLLQQFACCP